MAAAVLCLVIVYPVANGYYGIQIKKINIPRNIPATFFLNYPDFPDSCLLLQFAGL